MPKNSIIQFEKRYGEALRLHLVRVPSRRKDSPGHAIGGEAVSLGYDRLDLVRIHDRTMASIPSSSIPAPGKKPRRSAAEQFLISVLASIAKAGRVAKTTAAKALRMVSDTEARKVSLRAVQQELRSEISRREAVEKKLVEAARHYSRLISQSQRMQMQAKQLAHRLLLVQESERKEISRDLHDEVAQALAGINVQLAALKEASSIGGAELRKRIARTQRLIGRSVRIVHRYARELRPAMLDDLGLIPALRAYIRDLPECHGLSVRFHAPPEVETMNNKRRTVIYRVVQEALINICRHAKAHRVNVNLRVEDDTVRVEVHDDGKSFPVGDLLTVNANGRLGLIGMRERVEMVGGIFNIESSAEKGTRVCAQIPFRGKLRTEKP
jgi:signal transduction histidine kinase